MTVLCFVDTNVVLYAVMGPRNDPAKHRRAVAVLDGLDFGLSAQVLQEFYVNVVRKADPSPTPLQIESWLGWLMARPIAPVDSELVQSGIELSSRFQISYWDAAIIAAAERLGAAILYTEDLNHGQRYRSVLVHNPFRDL